jgi:short-subunit dehydrogenase
VNAFTESLALELEAFNVRVRLVIPDARQTLGSARMRSI